MKIFNITHKPIPYLNNDLYTPFQVNWNKDPIISKDFFLDNTLDNISSANDNFCELTACYWLWKNLNNVDYIGLCHYRRYFNLFPSKFSIRPSTQKRITKKELHRNMISTTCINKQRAIIKKDLKSYDMILPKARKMKYTIAQNYIFHHRSSDWNKTLEIVVKKYPEYENSIEKYLNNNNKFHQCNMMITKKEIWDNYHSWLFDILFELRDNVIIPEDNFQKRIFGFLSERLLNLYILHHNFKIKEYPLLFVTD